MLKHFLYILLIVGGTVMSNGEENIPAVVPTQRNDWSNGLCSRLTERAKQGKVKIMFLGDSIIQCWSFSKNNRFPGGLEVWEKELAPLGAVNFGVAGDKTENVLWRITAGKQLEKAYPEIIVLEVGTNNFHRKGSPDTPEMIAAGVNSILTAIEKISPDSKVLLWGLFPRDFKVDSHFRKTIPEVNGLLSKLADGKKVFFADPSSIFLSPDGSISQELLRDGLHPSPEGYRRWAAEMLPLLRQMPEK